MSEREQRLYDEYRWELGKSHNTVPTPKDAWNARARIAEQEKAELVGALRDLLYVSNKGLDERNRIRKRAGTLLAKYEQENQNDER